MSAQLEPPILPAELFDITELSAYAAEQFEQAHKKLLQNGYVTKPAFTFSEESNNSYILKNITPEQMNNFQTVVNAKQIMRGFLADYDILLVEMAKHPDIIQQMKANGEAPSQPFAARIQLGGLPSPNILEAIKKASGDGGEKLISSMRVFSTKIQKEQGIALHKFSDVIDFFGRKKAIQGMIPFETQKIMLNNYIGDRLTGDVQKDIQSIPTLYADLKNRYGLFSDELLQKSLSHAILAEAPENQKKDTLISVKRAFSIVAENSRY